jgi:hypothetical protein
VRLDWSAPWQAPDSVARELWAIEPGVELLYLAEGQWALVSRPERWTMPDGGRRRRLTGWNILAKERKASHANPVTLRVAQLLIAGCAVLWQGTFEHAPDHAIVEWFREANWRYRHGELEAALDARDAESNGEAHAMRAARSLQEWRETEGKSTYAHVFRGRRGVLQ